MCKEVVRKQVMPKLLMRKQAMHMQDRGFGLVELLIAMVLSLIVLGGIYSSIFSSVQSYEAVSSNKTLVEKNRMSLFSMRVYLQQAGQRSQNDLIQNIQQDQVNQVANTEFDWTFEQIVTGLNNQTTYPNAKEDTDVIAVRFFGDDDGGVFRCDGTEIDSGVSEFIAFYISTDNWLTCVDSEATPIAIEEDVENMQVLFGSNATGEEFRYLTADEVTDWTAINRIRIALLTAQNRDLDLLKNERTYNLLGEAVAASNDYKARQVITETILLQNE